MILKTVEITEGFKDLEKVEAVAKEAFPPTEYIAPLKLIEISKNKEFSFRALYDGETYVGFMAVLTYKELTYVCFLAIESNLRGGGYGSRALETINELYPDKQKVLSIEMIDETADNNEQRIRRRAFYLRNNYNPTGLFVSGAGMNFEILCSEKNFKKETFKEMMSILNIKNIDIKYFEK